MKSFAKGVITDPANLFGRNKPGSLLDKLTGHLNRCNNIQIVGERRFGKTSVLRCLESTIKADKRYIAVFVDLKEYSFIKGNANVYRFILARSVQEMSKNGLLNDQVNLKGVDFKKTNDWEDFYEKLLLISDYRMNDILKEFYSFFSEYYGATFILLIDEYEHLFLYSFDDPKGFFLFRNIGQSNLNEIIIPLCFVIAGTMTWDKICSITGSAELNTLSSEILYVDPLKFESFEEWFNSKIGIDVLESKISLKQLYSLVGGVPFYAMIVVETIKSGNSITFSALQPHFEEVYKNLDDKEARLVMQITRNENVDNKNYVAQILINKGLIVADGKRTSIKSELFRNYLLSKVDIKTLVQENEQSELYKKVSNLFQKMSSINETCENKSKPHIFKPVNQDPFLQSDLQLKCIDSDDIKRFSSAMYLIIFEKTKDNNKTLSLLPNKFQSKNDFVKLVDSLRHFFGGHLKDTFTLKQGQLSKADLLKKILNSPNNPNDSDYIIIQKYMLTSFFNYLKDIDFYIKDAKNDNSW